MIDLKLIGARTEIEAIVQSIASAFDPAIVLSWDTSPIQTFRFDTVSVSVLFAEGREELVADVEIFDEEGNSLGTENVVVLSAAPEGAHVRIVYHGMPQEGDHLAVIEILLPEDGTMVGTVTRQDSAELSTVWS